MTHVAQHEINIHDETVDALRTCMNLEKNPIV